MQANLFILWLTSIPFITWGGYFESPKVLIFFAGLFFIFIYWIRQYIVNKYVFEFSNTDKLFLFWLLILFVSGLFSGDLQTSILGGGYRHQGAIFFLGLFVLSKTIGSLSPFKKVILGKAIGIAMIIQSVIVIAQVVAGEVYFNRPISTVGEVNALAGMLSMGTYFIYTYLPSIFLIFSLVSVLLSMSKSGMLSFVTAILLFFSKGSKKLKGGVFIVLLLTTLFFAYQSLNSSKQSLFENRTSIWKMGFLATLQKPFIGYGPEMGSLVYQKSFEKYGINLQDFQVDRAHNLFLDIALWSGYLGLFVFTYFLVRMYKNSHEDRRIAILTFVAYSMFQPLSIVHWILFILVLNV